MYRHRLMVLKKKKKKKNRLNMTLRGWQCKTSIYPCICQNKQKPQMWYFHNCKFSTLLVDLHVLGQNTWRGWLRKGMCGSVAYCSWLCKLNAPISSCTAFVFNWHPFFVFPLSSFAYWALFVICCTRTAVSVVVVSSVVLLQSMSCLHWIVLYCFMKRIENKEEKKWSWKVCTEWRVHVLSV